MKLNPSKLSTDCRHLYIYFFQNIVTEAMVTINSTTVWSIFASFITRVRRIFLRHSPDADTGHLYYHAVVAFDV